MPFRKMKRIYGCLGILFFITALFAIAGCSGKQAEKTLDREGVEKSSSSVKKAAQSGRQINSIIVDDLEGKVKVRINGNKKMVYTSIKQSFPFGVAIYLPDTQIASDLVPPLSNNESIGNITVAYADQEKTTTKIEILLNEDLDYDVSEDDNSLNVFLASSSAKSKPVPKMVEKKAEKVSTPTRNKTKVSGKAATMTDIEFTTLEDGKSDIIVKTSTPVKFDITQGKNNKLYLNLYNTIIPEHHKRPILTYYFKSAVESLMPIQMPGKRNNSKIEINTRDKVPYRVVQDEDTISLFFEPSTIEPPMFTKATKKVASGKDVYMKEEQGQKTAQAELKNVPDVEKEEEDEDQDIRDQLFGRKKVYTGEKIKLDFFETDIKNVFRILRSVGGVNFAIDEDVTGKVTMTLDSPVPWDQVLELVLKMNNLGQVKDGNVIRIATIQTLAKEEEQIQAVIAAKKKSQMEKQNYEPLITEYIPINYSDAEVDIRPHLEQILSKGRGKLSVDKRTNMIIFTDIREKVEQAKEIIFKLDKVTPQIMIEAKIVEVTKEFSRDFGIGFGLSDSSTATSSYDVALNQPIGSPTSAGSFNFFRLFGSSVATLNLELEASESKGDAKIVSSPKVLTLDNKKAKIRQGFEVGYLVNGASGRVTVAFKDVDLLLEVTPHVTPDNRIAMTVYVTKNDIDGWVSGVPTLFNNEAETELLVNNNDTIVIAGIVKTALNDEVDKTPFLSEIPVVGRLFRTDSKTDERNELLIFITPTIVQLEQKRNTLQDTHTKF